MCLECNYTPVFIIHQSIDYDDVSTPKNRAFKNSSWYQIYFQVILETIEMGVGDKGIKP